MIEDFLRNRVVIEIDVRHRMRIASEKLADLQSSRRELRAEDDDVAEVAVEEQRAAKNERAHEDFAELCIGLHEAEKVVALHLDHLTSHRRPNGRQATAAGEQIQLAAELPLAVRRDQLLAVT